jgi:hypothetical protein
MEYGQYVVSAEQEVDSVINCAGKKANKSQTIAQT